ncbi:hypothetical protein [Shewanella chilikensis]|uniref:hypothetical protein n=1 Tax=Shewanella chilikensis TaxID=558541 RepID=UPI00399BE457
MGKRNCIRVLLFTLLLGMGAGCSNQPYSPSQDLYDNVADNVEQRNEKLARDQQPSDDRVKSEDVSKGVMATLVSSFLVGIATLFGSN